MTEKDPTIRLKEHNNRSNEWSSNNGPFELAYYERYLCKKDAILREKFYKSGIGRYIRDSILKTINKINGL